MSIAIHFFRKAVRLHDNRALLDAVETCKHIIPLYILDNECLNPNKVGVNRMGFILESLATLDEDLQVKGSKLFVAKGDVVEIIKTIVKELDVKKLTFERDTEPYNKNIDKELMDLADSHNIEVKAVWGHTLFDPEYLLFLNGGKSPMNMTGMVKLISSAKKPAKPLDEPETVPPPPEHVKEKIDCIYDTIPTLEDLKEYGYDSAKKSTWFVAGEKEAIRRMEEFLAQKKRVTTFEKPNTDPTALTPDTTALSPYLTLGSLSVRLFYVKLKEVMATSSSTKPPVSLEGQIFWRELAYLIGFSTPNFNQMRGNPVCRQIPWLEGDAAEEYLRKWEQGLVFCLFFIC